MTTTTTTTTALALGFGSKGPSQNGKLTRPPEKASVRRPIGRSVYATYRGVGPTCPTSCALQDIARARARHAGTVELDGGAAYRDSIVSVHTHRPDLQGWTYTHAWREAPVIEWRDRLPSNVGCVASLDRIDDAPEAWALGWQAVAIVLPCAGKGGPTPEEVARGKRFVRAMLPDVKPTYCPAQYLDTYCTECMRCSTEPHTDGRSVIVFWAHGTTQGKAGDPDKQGGCYAQHFRTGSNEARAGTEWTDFETWGRMLPYMAAVRWSVSGDCWSDWTGGE